MDSARSVRMYTQLNQYHVILEVEAFFPEDPQNCNPLFASERFFRSDGSGRNLVICFFQLILRRLERNHAVRAIHADFSNCSAPLSNALSEYQTVQFEYHYHDSSGEFYSAEHIHACRR